MRCSEGRYQEPVRSLEASQEIGQCTPRSAGRVRYSAGSSVAAAKFTTTHDDFVHQAAKTNRTLDCTVWSEQRLTPRIQPCTENSQVSLGSEVATRACTEIDIMSLDGRLQTNNTSQALKAPLSPCRKTGSRCYGFVTLLIVASHPPSSHRSPSAFLSSGWRSKKTTEAHGGQLPWHAVPQTGRRDRPSVGHGGVLRVLGVGGQVCEHEGDI